ncbi:hypothetical protein H4W81_002878 [Nonomuraea africana]|uniref:Uncharacterized protein n=1 Tax=Nonomuraea africana TaxID=46171 RepID=A0ABR9KDM5_9ACTN|nr:hypothetical protein [Nonomuraea africana]
MPAPLLNDQVRPAENEQHTIFAAKHRAAGRPARAEHDDLRLRVRLADSRTLGCPVEGPLLHVVRRQNINGGLGFR